MSSEISNYFGINGENIDTQKNRWYYYYIKTERIVIVLDFGFVVNSAVLGFGLAMDAFSVSLANGLNEPFMRKRKLVIIALVYAVFQAIMPLAGWFCVHTVSTAFEAFRPFIPWIALVLLLYIGGNMICEGLKVKEEKIRSLRTLGFAALIMQGIATSIDALSVGFTIAEYDFFMALTAALIIAAVTFVVCSIGVKIGKSCASKISGKSTVLGGGILIFIGLEIFVKGVFM